MLCCASWAMGPAYTRTRDKPGLVATVPRVCRLLTGCSRAHERLARVDARLRVGAGGVGSGAQGLLREPVQGEARRRE